MLSRRRRRIKYLSANGDDNRDHTFTHARTIESCISDVKVWVVQNKLQLNDDKTEILLIGSAPGTDLPSSLYAGQRDIPFSNVARHIGVIFDSQLALKEQVNKLCYLAYWRSGGSVQSGSIFSLKTPKLSFPLLFSLGLIIVMLSLLALLRFSLITFKERSAAQLASLQSS